MFHFSDDSRMSYFVTIIFRERREFPIQTLRHNGQVEGKFVCVGKNHTEGIQSCITIIIVVVVSFNGVYMCVLCPSTHRACPDMSSREEKCYVVVYRSGGEFSVVFLRDRETRGCRTWWTDTTTKERMGEIKRNSKNVKRCCQSHDPTCSLSACEVSIKSVPITTFELFIHSLEQSVLAVVLTRISERESGPLLHHVNNSERRGM